MNLHNQKKNLKSIINANFGFTITELLIGMVILAILAVVGMQITEQSNKSVTKLNLDTDVTTTLNEINSMLSDPKKCGLTFEGDLTPDSIVKGYEEDTPGPPPTFKATGRMYYVRTHEKGAAGYGNSALKIDSYELVKGDPGEEEKEDVLLVKFVNRNSLKGVGGPETITRRINMYVEWTVGATPMPTTCRALSTSTAHIWSRGAGDDIYYNGGNVGIDTDDPKSALDVNGDIKTDKITATTFMYSSDQRLKKNIELIENPMEKVESLRGVSFDWRKDSKSDYGFIAQEVQRSIPEIVKKGPGQETLSVDYVKIVPVLVEAIKKQQIEIEELKNRIKELQR